MIRMNYWLRISGPAVPAVSVTVLFVVHPATRESASMKLSVPRCTLLHTVPIPKKEPLQALLRPPR